MVCKRTVSVIWMVYIHLSLTLLGLSYGQEILPDLTITALSAPEAASTQESIEVSFTVKNQGDGDAIGGTLSNTWADEVVLSNDDKWDASDIGLFSTNSSGGHVGTLAIGASYTVTNTISIPKNLSSGTYYILVKADSNSYLYESDETNNILVRPIIIKVPDLVVTSVQAPASASTREQFEVSFTVKNQGDGDAIGGTLSNTWADEVVLSNDDKWDAFDIGLFSTNSSGGHVGTLAIGESYTVTNTVGTLSSGTYYLLVKADSNSYLYESDETNNVFIAGTIRIKVPDLAVTALNAPAEASTREQFEVSFTVKNQGDGDAIGGTPYNTWADYVVLSSDDKWDNSDISLFSTGPLGGHAGTLASGADYTVTGTASIPRDLSSGNYYLLARADYNSYLYESNEDNNISVRPITIKVPDLVVTSTPVPSEASWHEGIEVSFTVKNQGEGNAIGWSPYTSPYSWIDRAYLSTDDKLDNSDRLVLDSRHTGSLASGASYTITQKAYIPILPVGNYYLLIKTDAYVGYAYYDLGLDNVYESDETNNVFIAGTIKLKAPDLTVTSMRAPFRASPQERIDVSFTVMNQGEGDVITGWGGWGDFLYLSTDDKLDISDRLLFGAEYRGRLDSGKSYTVAQSVVMPSDLASGSYYLLAKTDGAFSGITERIDESREWNNVLPRLITIVEIGNEGGLSETHSNESNLVEELYSRKANLTDAAVTGDLSGTINFTDLEIVNVNSGVFKDKGFSKGRWEATLEGVSYQGDWQGVSYLVISENKIYLKGTVSGGEASGIVEGHLSESVPGSGIYDQYQAVWRLGRLGDKTISATLNIEGTLSYFDSSPYPSTKLYVLQTAFSGTTLGHYNETLNSVVTHLRVADESSLYNSAGFSFISYVSKSGDGEGWTYDKEISAGKVEMKGLFTSPLLGIVSGDLDETRTPRTLSISIERVDLALPPAPDLKVKVWSPQMASPGQAINYIIEYRNDGLKPAENIALVYLPPYPVDFIWASSPANYDDVIHIVRWDINNIPAKSIGYLSAQVRIFWAIPMGSRLIGEAYQFSKADADSILSHSSPGIGETIRRLLYEIFRAFIGESSPVPIPDEDWAEAARGYPAIRTRIAMLEANDQSFEYWREIHALTSAMQSGHSLEKDGWKTTDGQLTFPPGTGFKEIVLKLREHYGYTPTDEPNKTSTTLNVASDPNELLVSPEGDVRPGDKLDYTINYENEGEGDAYGVYITDTLEGDLDDSTLIVNDGGKYDSDTRTITWFIGELLSKQKGSVTFAVNVKTDAQDGSEVINFATVYFPSVPEATRTNGVVNKINSSALPLDDIAPATTALASPQTNQAGWNNTDVTIALNAADNESGSGVKEIHYKLTGVTSDEKVIQGSTANILISSEGITGLEYYAIDNAGNVEPAKSLEIKIDKTPPVTTSLVSPPPDNGGYIRSLPVKVSFSASDNLSGVAFTTPEKTFTTPGTYQLEYYSRDTAGNTENTKTVTLNIVPQDTTAPRISLELKPVTIKIGRRTFTIPYLYTLIYSATDDESGVKELKAGLALPDISNFKAHLIKSGHLHITINKRKKSIRIEAPNPEEVLSSINKEGLLSIQNDQPLFLKLLPRTEKWTIMQVDKSLIILAPEIIFKARAVDNADNVAVEFGPLP